MPRLPSHGRGHWFDPSTAHHAGSSRPRGVRQSDRELLADGGGGLLNGIKQHVRILRVEEPLELATAGSHSLCHFALADTPFLHGLRDFPGQHPLPGKCSHLLVKPLGSQELVERRAQMLISTSCHFPLPSAALRQDLTPPRVSAVSS